MLPRRRRRLAFASGVLLLGAPALSACGFDYPTDRINTITNGVSDRDQSVWVLNTLVVASRPGSGTLVATLSNKSEEPVRLTSVTAEGDGALRTTQDVEIGLFPGAAANLASDPQLRVSGDFEAGQFLTVTFGFDNGEEVTLQAHVVTDCGQYDGLDLAPPLELVGKKSEPEPQYDCGPPVSGPGVEPNTEGPQGEAVDSEEDEDEGADDAPVAPEESPE